MKARSDKALDFSLSIWTSAGSNFGVHGTAKPTPSGWRYEENMGSRNSLERCAVVISKKGDGYSLSTVDGARCEGLSGHGAVLYSPVNFPAKSRVSEIFDPSDVGNLDCSDNKRSR
jgi:hypothetical protein